MTACSQWIQIEKESERYIGLKENLKTYKWILSRVRSFIPVLVVISLIRIVASYLSVKYSLVMRDVIDAAISGTGDEFKRTLLVMAIFVAVMLVLKLVNRNLTQVTGFKMNRMWKKDMTQVIMEADYQKVSKYHSGNLLSRMSSDVNAVDTGLISFVPGVLALLTKLVTAIIVMGTLAPELTLVICIGGILVVFASTIFRRKLKELHKLVQEANARVTSFIQEALERLHMVQALDVADEIEKREDGLLEKRYRIQLKRKNLGLVASGGLSIICILAELGILLWSVLQLRAGYITFGTLTAMVTLFAKLESPFVSMSGVLPQYIAMMGSADRLREICDLRDAGESTCSIADAGKLYESMTSITGRGIWFKYADAKDDEYVIKDLDFEIPKGAFCAVVGSSGIGKSTLMKLLLGMCAPNQGELVCAEGRSQGGSVCAEGAKAGESGCTEAANQLEQGCAEVGSQGEQICDGVANHGDVSISRATRSLFAYVPQGNMLMSGTLKENLLLTKPDASDKEITAAIHIADMEGFVTELPDGLDTMIGENALGISEGQAQRVSIARAVLSGKPVILLDEATSALDAQTEQRVLERIRSLEGKTIIAVTHRPAAREMSDCEIEM